MTKRYLIQGAAFNLGVVMRSLFGVGKPRVLQGGGGAAFAALFWLMGVRTVWVRRWYGRPAR